MFETFSQTERCAVIVMATMDGPTQTQVVCGDQVVLVILNHTQMQLPSGNNQFLVETNLSTPIWQGLCRFTRG